MFLNCCLTNSFKKTCNLYYNTTNKEYNRSETELELDLTNLTDNENRLISVNKDSSCDIFQKLCKRIIDELKTNSDLIYLKNDFIFKILKQRSEHKDNLLEIDQLITINRQNRYPSDYIHCLLANHTYCYKESIRYNNCSVIWKELEEEKWEIYSELRLTGYQSIIYVNEINKQVVVAYQGFKFKLTDLFNTTNDSYLIYVDSLFKKCNCLIQNHLLAVYVHVTKAFDLSQKLNYTLSFTSYSFGSILADLSLFILNKYFKFNGARSVTFEAIGSNDLLNKLNSESNEIDLNDFDITTYLLKPLLLNTYKQHLGKIRFFKSRMNYHYSEIKIKNSFDCEIRNKKRIHNSYLYDNAFVFNVTSVYSLCSVNLKTLLSELKDDSNETSETHKWPILNYEENYSTNYFTEHHCLLTCKHKIFEKKSNVKIPKKFFNSLKMVCSELRCVFCFAFKNLNEPGDNKLKFIFNSLTDTFEIINFKKIYKLLEEITNLSSKRIINLNTNEGSGFLSSYFLRTKIEFYNFKTSLLRQLDYINDSDIDKISQKLKNLKYTNFKSENLNYLTDLISKNIGKIKRIIRSNLFITVNDFLNQIKFNPVIIFLYESNYENTCFELRKLAKKLQINLNQTEKEIIKSVKTILNKYRKFDFVVYINENSKFIANKVYASNLNICTLNSGWFNAIYNEIPLFNQFYCLSELIVDYKFNDLNDEKIKESYQSQHLNNFIKLLLKRNFQETKDSSQINHLMKYYFDLFTFIEIENKTAFDFMFYLCYLDGNNINLKLLKSIFNSIDDFKHYDLENEILDYLIETSFITKINNEKCFINEYYQGEFLDQINIHNYFKANIMNKIVSSLVNLILPEDNLTLNDIEIFYKQSNVIRSIDWSLKESNLEYELLIEILDYIDKNYCFEMISFDQFHKIEENNIKELIFNKLKEDSDELLKDVQDLKLIVRSFENILNEIELKIFDTFRNMIDEIQLKKELLLIDLKTSKGYNEDEDESKLDDELKMEFLYLDNYSEILMNELIVYRHQAIEKFNRTEKMKAIYLMNSLYEFISYISKIQNKNFSFDKNNIIDMLKDLVKESENLIQLVNPQSFISLTIRQPSEDDNRLHEILVKEEIDFNDNLIELSLNSLVDFKIKDILYLENNRLLISCKHNNESGILVSVNNAIQISSFIRLNNPIRYWLNIIELKKICIIQEEHEDSIILDYDLNKIELSKVLIRGSSSSSYYGIDNNNVLREFDLQFNQVDPNPILVNIINDINENEDDSICFLNIDYKDSRFILVLQTNESIIRIYNDNPDLIAYFRILESFQYTINSERIIIKMFPEPYCISIKYINFDGSLIKEIILSDFLQRRLDSKDVLSPTGDVYFFYDDFQD